MITLLGDAASPIPPNLGQGGNKALEDAGVLAACLARWVLAAVVHANLEQENGTNEAIYGLLEHTTYLCAGANYVPWPEQLRHGCWCGEQAQGSPCYLVAQP